MRALRRLQDLAQAVFAELDFRIAGKWVVLGVAVGVLAGVGSVLFWDLAVWLTGTIGAGFGVEGAWDSADIGAVLDGRARWAWASLAIAGGLLSGLVVRYVAPEAAGGGIDEIIHQYHQGEGVIRRRAGWAKMASSAGLIATGGSAGLEGPAGQIGASFVRFVAKPLGLSASERRTLLVAGAGAGIGAVFQTPLGGAIFATEVLYSEPEFESDAIVPSLIASIVGYSVFHFLVDKQHLFTIPSGLGFGHPAELVAYGALAVGIVFWSWVYVFFYRSVIQERIFDRLPVPGWSKPAIGATVVAVMIGVEPLLSGGGYRAVDLALSESLPILTLLGLLVFKMIATAFSVGSGGSGGIFAPTILMGTVLGAGLGMVFQRMNIPWAPEVPAMAVVGMGGFFAAISKVPLAMIIMGFEMTRGYELLAPMMLVVTLSYTFGPVKKFHPHQVRNRFSSPAHVGDFLVDVLKRLHVRDILRSDPALKVVPPTMSLTAIMPIVVDTTQNYFPVVDDEGVLRGVFSLDDVRKVLGEQALGSLLVADDLAIHRPIVVTPEETLDSVMRKFVIKNLEELPVVRDLECQVFEGMISRRDVIEAYNKRMYFDGFQQG